MAATESGLSLKDEHQITESNRELLLTGFALSAPDSVHQLLCKSQSNEGDISSKPDAVIDAKEPQRKDLFARLICAIDVTFCRLLY